MEENKKTKKESKGVRFNILDLIIIVGILFIITALIIMALPKFNTKTESGKKLIISYTLVFEAVSEDAFDKISVGDPLIDTAYGKALGKVSETAKIEPYYTYVLETTSEGMVDMLIFAAASPSFITAPLPNCFSIWERAISNAFCFSIIQ